MGADEQTSVDNRRGSDREPFEGAVTLRFEPVDIVGPGQNISDEGVFFVANATLRVSLRVGADDTWRPAELVRLQSMGEGRLGFAVKFVP